MRWVYTESDPALMLFTAAVDRFRFAFPDGARILELGCAESDWLERMHVQNPSFDLWGVDTRLQARGGPGVSVLHDDAMDPSLFAAETFDAIVLLGALEHFGLGFYGDPVHPAGDTLTMMNVARWLKPGGLVYFDVPAQPSYRVAENRHFRMYSPDAIDIRLLAPPVDGLRERRRAYSLPEPDAGTWCPEPCTERVPYWFAAVLAEKVASP